MYQPILRGATPEDAVKKYLGIKSDSPLIRFHGIDIAIIMDGHINDSDLFEPIAFVVRDLLMSSVGESRFKLLGWLYRKQHRDGKGEFLFPMEKSLYSWWCFVEMLTGDATRDFNFINERMKTQERGVIPDDWRNWEKQLLARGSDAR